MPNHAKNFEVGSADASGRDNRKGAWQWYDGGKRRGALTDAERAKRLRSRKSRAERAIGKAVEVARRLQKAAGALKLPKAKSGTKRVVPGQKASYVSVDRPLCRFVGKVVKLWESSRESQFGSAFVIMERSRQDLKEDKRRGKYVAVLPHNVLPL